jgi:predicted MPP superfamily phosphohydrolase
MGINIKKPIIRIAIGFVSVLVTILVANAADTLLSTNSSQVIPTYAGFRDIQPTKNHFIFVGDTQATSHWEFWRERNDEERKLIINEITRQEPAFVVHLGDLTTRGSSTKHWQQFDDFHKEFRERKIPYFPILGNHEFYGSDEKGLDHYFKRFPYLERRRWLNRCFC